MTDTAWTGMVTVDDTALAVTDSGGAGVPVVYLNGSYADRRHWRRTIADLGPGYRHLTFDERARGGSRGSSDCSFEACLRDLDAVLDARGVERPVLVGWSYGAFLAVHHADRRPDRTRAVVGVDGALPYGLTDEAGRQRIHRLFRRMRPLLPLAAPFGLAARLSAAEHALINIEINEISAACGPVLDRLRCPVRYVLGSGDGLGATDGQHDDARTALAPHLAHNPNLQVSAQVASNHGAILRRDAAAVARAVREAVVAARVTP